MTPKRSTDIYQRNLVLKKTNMDNNSASIESQIFKILNARSGKERDAFRRLIQFEYDFGNRITYYGAIYSWLSQDIAGTPEYAHSINSIINLLCFSSAINPKVCFDEVILEQPCQFGTNCRHSHDLNHHPILQHRHILPIIRSYAKGLKKAIEFANE